MVTKTVTKKSNTAPAPARFDTVYVCNKNRWTKSNTVKTLVKIAQAIKDFHGEELEQLLCGVAEDFAVRQRFLKFYNLCLGKVGVVREV